MQTCDAVVCDAVQVINSFHSPARTLAGVYFLPVVHWTAVLSVAGCACTTAGMLMIRRAHAAVASMAQRVLQAAIVYSGGCLLSTSATTRNARSVTVRLSAI